MATHFEIEDGFIHEENEKAKAWIAEDYEHLDKQLRRKSVNIEDLVAKAQRFRVAVPSWGVGTGGALRTFPRVRRAARHLRKARRLRHHLQTRPLDSRRLFAHPLGQA